MHGDFLARLVGDAELTVVVVAAFGVAGGAGVVSADLVAQIPGDLFRFG